MLRAILFDLDDTLFDHRTCAREALTNVHRAHTCFAAVPFADFERDHAEHLEALHIEVLAGRLDIEAARTERFRRLFLASAGDAGHAPAAAAAYRRAYLAARRAVPGAAALLARLRVQTRIAVVSNNLLAEQQEKLRESGLDGLVDALIVSEAAGMAKPDPRIFHVALERLDAHPGEALVVGDSWAADIEGARAAGLASVWFNPLGVPAPDPEAGIPELRTLEPVEHAMAILFASYARAHRR